MLIVQLFIAIFGGSTEGLPVPSIPPSNPTVSVTVVASTTPANTPSSQKTSTPQPTVRSSTPTPTVRATNTVPQPTPTQRVAPTATAAPAVPSHPHFTCVGSCVSGNCLLEDGNCALLGALPEYAWCKIPPGFPLTASNSVWWRCCAFERGAECREEYNKKVDDGSGWVVPPERGVPIPCQYAPNGEC